MALYTGLEYCSQPLAHLSSPLSEMMYASLDLVTMIVEATQDLPSHYIKDCFSHILIQGGFTLH